MPLCEHSHPYGTMDECLFCMQILLGVDLGSVLTTTFKYLFRMLCLTLHDTQNCQETGYEYEGSSGQSVKAVCQDISIPI